MKSSIDEVAFQLKELLTFPDLELSGGRVREHTRLVNTNSSQDLLLCKEHFHAFGKTAPPWKTLAVDASLKALVDCGAFVIVILKTAFEVWQLGSRRIKEGIETEVQLVRSLEAARQEMAVKELEAAIAASQFLSGQDIVLLDRPLSVRPRTPPSVRLSLRQLASELQRRGIRLLGVCKSSRLGIEGGAPLIGFLLHHASMMGISGCWFYHPLISSGDCSGLRFGEPCVASLEPTQDFAFRIDLGGDLSKVDEATGVLGSIACIGDRYAYGYPYPLRSAHEACSISRTEVDICRQRLFEAARKQGISPNLRYALKATSFREEVLLS